MHGSFLKRRDINFTMKPFIALVTHHCIWFRIIRLLHISPLIIRRYDSFSSRNSIWLRRSLRKSSISYTLSKWWLVTNGSFQIEVTDNSILSQIKLRSSLKQCQLSPDQLTGLFPCLNSTFLACSSHFKLQTRL